MSTLNLFSSNLVASSAGQYSSDYFNVSATSSGWLSLSNSSLVVVAEFKGTAISYDSYGRPDVGLVSSVSRYASDGTKAWELSNFTKNANDIGSSSYYSNVINSSDPLASSYIRNMLAAGNDTINGSAYNDRLYYYGGNDAFNGNGGQDELNFSNYNNGTTINLSTGRYSSTLWSGQIEQGTISNIERVVGTNYNDLIVGSKNDDYIFGWGGSDTIQAGAGNDVIDSGNNYAYSGFDTIDGGVGTDTISYRFSLYRVDVNLETGSGAEVGSTDSRYRDTLSNIENITGSRYGDKLTGNQANNVISGGLGDDSINGAGGFDTADYSDSFYGVTANLSTGVAKGWGTDRLQSIEGLNGSAANDVFTGNTGANLLSGMAGNDRLLGGAGNDTLVGGAGTDRLSGEAGNDTFRFTAWSDLSMGTARDVITDFTRGADKIDLSQIDAQAALAGDQAFAFVTTGFGKVAGQVAYANGIVSINTDTDAAAEYEIQLVGTVPATLAATDFVL